jgi:hypothetical protein
MDTTMNEADKRLLQQMIRKNDTKDNTNKIRELKHSSKIRSCVSIIQNTRRRCGRNATFQELDKECSTSCSFLFINYPIIYNKILKDEIDIKVLYTFLDILEKIERGERDQHEASYEIGMLLRSMYVDKRLTKENKRQDKTNTSRNNKPANDRKKLSYKEFLEIQNKK